MKVPGTRGVSCWVRSVLVTFANSRAAKHTEMTDSRRCADEELPWSCNFTKLDIGTFDREAIMNKARVLEGVVDVRSV